MHSRISLALVLACSAACGAALPPAYAIDGDDPGAWPQILSSIGFTTGTGLPAGIYVVRNSSSTPVNDLLKRIEAGAFVIVEGESDLATALGFQATKKRVVVRSIIDHRAPGLSIVWEKALELPVFTLPKEARIFAVERWTGAPLLAGLKRGSGAALWLAASPGQQGYERFPYILQGLTDLGLQPPLHSARLWAFFDSAYRSRVDLDYFAARWRRSGIAALQVAGWHYWERNPEADDYLRRLIAACHRNAIVVYVWLELPHVSDKFWDDHPEWREQTALGQDAQLDWRRLMNLNNPAAAAEVRKGLRELISGFDWDGVNLAELYFESLEGYANPARFTPMNADVRKAFARDHLFDPADLFKTAQPDPARMRVFLDWRAALARRMQAQWIDEIEAVRATRPDLDLVLTHVDDRFDTRMHDLIGADAAAVLPMLAQHDFTFLIEDPATIWNLGPQRYPQIAERYRALTDRRDKLAIDISIVERYQDVYPTKQQTGTELFELVHLASASFNRVALYFENSILSPDLPLLAAAGASVDKMDQAGGKLVVTSKLGVGIPWTGPATVNGKPWPIRDDRTLWLPPGACAIAAAPADVPLRVLDFNGTIRSALPTAKGLELAYESTSRAIAVLASRPSRVDVDGLPLASVAGETLILPRGQHLVIIE
jgi:hypothetical protein